MAKILVILRHENSLNVVGDYLTERGHAAVLVALDPVELPAQVPTALKQIEAALMETPQAIVLGTKVYDEQKSEKNDPPKRLIAFLNLLRDWGAGDTPVLLTHLAEMPRTLIEAVEQTGLQVSYVENDNLKRDGMSNLGPLIDKALAL